MILRSRGPSSSSLFIPCIASTSCLLFSLTTFLVISVVSGHLGDPYRILGVSRSASITEIKNVYKELVRKWHPDKNNDPEAENKFIEINQAYELLSDPERREEFDNFGTTADTPNFRKRHDYSTFRRFDFDPFESFFASDSASPGGFASGGGSSKGKFHYQFDSSQGNLFRKQSITTKAYENRVIPDSFTRPHLILFYGDLCVPCFHAEPVWQKIMNDLEPLGVQFNTIHSQHESSLARRIGVTSLPYVIGVADGIVKHYKDNQLNLVKGIEFIRRLLPRGMIVTVDDSNYLDFLKGYTLDNRVRVIFANNDRVIRLRYLLLAFKFKERIAAAHMSLTPDSAATESFTTKYAVDRKMDSMLIFNEDISRPVSSMSAVDLKTQIMNDVLEANQFLQLPRLSSQGLFDQLCPPESIRTRRLCIVLVTNNIPSHEVHREAMREFMREHLPNLPRDRYRFMYVFEEKQKDFVKALSVGFGSPEVSVLHVIVFWRRETDRVFFEWLPREWDASNDESLNQSQSDLLDLLTRLSKNLDVFTHDVRFPALIDEQAHGFIGKIVKRILVMTDGMTENISQKEILPVVSVGLSLGFILLIGYIMQYLVKMEEESIQERYRRLGRAPPGAPAPKPEPKLNIHELRGETYNGLIRLLKPGCRTLVLLVDKSSKPKLLTKFYRCVYPYRKNKALMFAYLLIEKNLEWYKKILQQTLGEHRELNINPKNCIGTVISLNGFRKYFCVYHAKHPESSGSRRRRNRDTESGAGAFLGFEETNLDLPDEADLEAGGSLIHSVETLTPEEETLSSIVFEEHLLDGLTNWLDRLFDGTTQKYYINYWPEHMK